MATIASTALTVSDANANLDAALRALRDAEDAVVAGTSTLTADELSTLVHTVEVAELMVAAAQRGENAAEQEAEAARAKARGQALRNDVNNSPHKIPELVAMLRDIETAVTAFVGAVNERNTSIAVINRRLRKGDFEAVGLSAPGEVPLGPYAANYSVDGEGEYQIRAGDFLLAVLDRAAHEVDVPRADVLTNENNTIQMDNVYARLAARGR